MSASLIDSILVSSDSLFSPIESGPLSHRLNLLGENVSRSESQSPHLTDSWQKRENTEHSDTEEETQIHQLMEDVKRYIRSIDISNL